jgi:hypothetical protein
MCSRVRIARAGSAGEANAVFDFDHKNRQSRAAVRETCISTIQVMIPGCLGVTAVDDSKEIDKRGIDYIAVLNGKTSIYIDHKARIDPCSSFWQRDPRSHLPIPELALETHSVYDAPQKTGWTLDESKLTDYVLHTFHPDDTAECWLLPFQLLRIAFARYHAKWSDIFKSDIQQSCRSGRVWRSRCVFVPVQTVVQAITEAMRGNTHLPNAIRKGALQQQYLFDRTRIEEQSFGG